MRQTFILAVFFFGFSVFLRAEGRKLPEFEKLAGPWPQKGLNALCKDRAGNTWLGWNNRSLGIIRKDGLLLQVGNYYFGNDNSVVSLSASKITDEVFIGGDHFGLWVGNITGKWKKIKLPNDARTVFQTIELKDGSLVILSEEGCVLYNRKTQKFRWLPVFSQNGNRPTHALLLPEKFDGKKRKAGTIQPIAFGFIDGEVLVLKDGEPETVAQLTRPVSTLYFENKKLFIGTTHGLLVNKIGGQFKIHKDAIAQGYKHKYTFIKKVFRHPKIRNTLFVLSRDQGLFTWKRGKLRPYARGHVIGFIDILPAGKGFLLATGQSSLRELNTNLKIDKKQQLAMRITNENKEAIAEITNSKNLKKLAEKIAKKTLKPKKNTAKIKVCLIKSFLFVLQDNRYNLSPPPQHIASQKFK